jgi:hypothetical protein
MVLEVRGAKVVLDWLMVHMLGGIVTLLEVVVSGRHSGFDSSTSTASLQSCHALNQVNATPR